jgi:hypothetical protein
MSAQALEVRNINSKSDANAQGRFKNKPLLILLLRASYPSGMPQLTETDCVAGVVGLELGDVALKCRPNSLGFQNIFVPETFRVSRPMRTGYESP